MIDGREMEDRAVMTVYSPAVGRLLPAVECLPAFVEEYPSLCEKLLAEIHKQEDDLLDAVRLHYRVEGGDGEAAEIATVRESVHKQLAFAASEDRARNVYPLWLEHKGKRAEEVYKDVMAALEENVRVKVERDKAVKKLTDLPAIIKETAKEAVEEVLRQQAEAGDTPPGGLPEVGSDDPETPETKNDRVRQRSRSHAFSTG